jgi:hypothetical protein
MVGQTQTRVFAVLPVAERWLFSICLVGSRARMVGIKIVPVKRGPLARLCGNHCAARRITSAVAHDQKKCACGGGGKM